MSLSHFKIDTSWDDPGGVRSPELAATWAKVCIFAGHTVFTRVLDARANTVREDVYFPLYPLAEWIACNWFFLFYEAQNPRKQNRDAEARHNIRSGREGFAFPNLAIWPEGETTRIESTRCSAEKESVEYLVEDHAEVDAKDVRRELSNLVDLVCERLASQNISGTLLQDEWNAIQNMNREELAFCAACAKLGQDPFNIDDDTAENIVHAGGCICEDLQDDFFDAADLDDLFKQLNSLRRYLDCIANDSEDISALKRLRGTPLVADLKAMPWEQGYEAARRLRETLSLNGDRLASENALKNAFNLQPSEWRSCLLIRKTPKDFFDSLVALNQTKSPVFVVSDKRSEARRFAFCRALFEYLTSEGPALTNASYSCRQKRNRAFAAEFLAPAAAIKEQISTDFAEEETIAALAGCFGVSEFVIQHQIRNHQIAETVTHIP